MRYIILFCYFTFTLPLAAQTDWQKWGKSEVSYLIGGSNNKQNGQPQDRNLGGFFLNTSKTAYKFLVSDLDGDNCPFQPTCSSFFVQSVRATNLFQGILMFSDRFTRDMNLVKINHYPFSKNLHLFDPVYNYLLIPEKIRYFPPSEFVNE